MSHVTICEADTREQQVTDIKALAAACGRVGLRFKEGQTNFHTWATDHGGRLVGDYPLPTGYKNIAEVGNSCRHAIGLPTEEVKKNDTYSHYEIGVVESKKFPGTYSLAYDFFGGAIDKKAGTKLAKLQMYYQAEAARNKARGLGYSYSEKVTTDGGLDVKIDMTVKLGV